MARAGGASNDSFTSEHKKELAYKEHYIVSLRNQLADIIHDTMNQIRKKKTRTIEESMAENAYDEPEQDMESESSDDEPTYNPKNLPLGWDGKPIPYWLYKLHGLSIEYKCEICGNYSYWGRRAFERHFQEWRHAYGMKCLRIPNTVHFKEITSINDALMRNLSSSKFTKSFSWRLKRASSTQSMKKSTRMMKDISLRRRPTLI